MTTTASPVTTGALTTLYDLIRRETRTPSDWNVIVDTLVAALPSCLPPADAVLSCVPASDRRGSDTSRVLHVESDGSFSVVALISAPGQATSIHDHTTWCVTAVLAGTETEERFRLAPSQTTLELVGSRTDDVGAVGGFAPPGDIHRVTNASEEVSVSIHIYGTDIHRVGSSVRRTYDLPVVSDPHRIEALDQTFAEPLLRGDGPGGWTIVTLPDSGDRLGVRRAVKVSGTIDGHPFRATLLPIGGGAHILPVRARLLRDLDAAPGSTVTVHLDGRYS